MDQLITGQLNVLNIVIWTVLAFVLAMAGGAMTGMKLAAKDIGYELSALMGAMYGATGAVPGILLGLIVLAVI